MNERRHFSRLNLSFGAEVDFQGQTYSGEIIDLALKGVLLELEHFPAQKNDLCTIRIPLSELVVMTFEGRLIHQEDNRFGFKFEYMDLDSLTHLRKCLEFNADDPDKIAEELFFLAINN